MSVPSPSSAPTRDRPCHCRPALWIPGPRQLSYDLKKKKCLSQGQGWFWVMEEHREEAAGLLDQSGCFQNQVVLKGGSVTPGKGSKRKDLYAQRQQYSQLDQWQSE